MAVYTPVSQEELIAFLSEYNIGNLVSYEGIAQGVSNTNYFVTTDQGHFILTLFEPHRVDPVDIPFFINYAITLQREGVACPKTLIRKDGKNISILNGRPAGIFSLLKGHGAHVAMLSPPLCKKAGMLLGHMHRDVAGFQQTAPNHFSLPHWKEWISVIGKAMDEEKEGLYDLVKKELAWLESHWPVGLPSGAIHADFFPDNVFFENWEVTGVIDFHFVCTDFFAYDLAIALNAWSFDEINNFRRDRMEAMIQGYNVLRPLSQEEKDSLAVLLRGAALRFLLSRIEEKRNWKPGDFMTPHDPLVFEKRLRHFQETKI
jgi:homoserine kinase type II